MEINLQTLSKLLKSPLKGKLKSFASRKVNICTDSRQIKKGDVYWALKGEIHDGHAFVNSAIKAGCIAAVVNKKWVKNISKSETMPDLSITDFYLEVSDTNKSLLTLSSQYSDLFKIPKIAITGSNGKTTTKDMIVKVLEKKGKVCGTLGNLNNQFGVPFTLFRLTSKHKSAVIEMGTNHPGEIKVLTKAASPNIAVITNIGQSHLEFFKNEAGVYKEKKTIAQGFKSKGTLVLNYDDVYLKKLKDNKLFKVLSFGIENGKIRATQIEKHNDCYHFNVGLSRFKLSVPGRHNIYNALASIAVGRLLKIPDAKIASALNKFESSSRRMEYHKIKSLHVYEDYYNANPSSMASALQILADSDYPGKKIAILGDMAELGENEKLAHRQMGELLARLKVDVFYGMGSLAKEIELGAIKAGIKKSRAQSFKQIEPLLAKLKKDLVEGDVLLIKGSRKMKMERIGHFLKEQF